jgi:hypothetical protein
MGRKVLYPVGTKERPCTKCKETKAIDQFGLTPKNTFRSWCYECMAKNTRERYFSLKGGQIRACKRKYA